MSDPAAPSTPPARSGLRLAAVIATAGVAALVVLLLVILMVRPHGLFGTAEIERL